MRLKILLSLFILIGFSLPAKADDSAETLKKLQSILFNGNSIEEITQLCQYNSEGRNCDAVVQSFALGEIELIRTLGNLQGIQDSIKGEKEFLTIQERIEKNRWDSQKKITEMQIKHEKNMVLFNTFSRWGLLFPFSSQ